MAFSFLRKRAHSSSTNRSLSSLGQRRCTIESLEDRHLLAVLFADSFEQGSNSNDWVGNWVEYSQNDWFRSTQRATDGARSAEVDGSANNATLTLANPIDLSGYASAELTFDWLIENRFDSGEYVSLDVSSDGGATWQSNVRQLNGNVDAENTWHNETIDLTAYASADVVVRFRAKASRGNEDANVDNVQIVGTLPSGPPLVSISDATASEGGMDWAFAERFDTDEQPVAYTSWDVARSDVGDLYVTTVLGEELDKLSAVMRIDGETGEVESEFIPFGAAGLQNAREITVQDEWIYVANKGTNEVLRFGLTTGTPDPAGAFVAAGDNGLTTPRGITFDDDGNLFVISKGNNEILKYDSRGEFLGVFASSVTSAITPNDLTIDDSGNVYVAGDAKVLKYADDGTFFGVFANAGSANTTSVDFGPDGMLYVGSGSDETILRFNGQTGEIVDVIADSLGLKQGIVFDGQGSLFVANSHVAQTARVLRYASSSAAVFTVSLSTASDQMVSVDFTTAAGTANAGSDFTAASGTLVFDPGITSRTIVVPAIDDATDEGDENFVINLSSPAGAVIQNGQGTATIEDDDGVQNDPNTLYVYDIRFESIWGGWYRRAIIEIRSDSNADGVGSSQDAPAVGVNVIIQFDGQNYSGTTDGNGVFRTNWIRNPGGSGHYANVIDLALTGYIWNALELDLEDDSDDDGHPDAVFQV